MARTLTITRNGGFSGVRHSVIITDPNQQDEILKLLPQQPLVGIMGMARDTFSYSFKLKKGFLDRDRGMVADRSIPETLLTSDLRKILANLRFNQ